MRQRVVNTGASRDDPKWINRRMASVVMPLYVIHVNCAAHTGGLKDVFGVIEEIWVFTHHFLVALEVDRVHLLFIGSLLAKISNNLTHPK